jgi:hypothetical protein
MNLGEEAGGANLLAVAMTRRVCREATAGATAVRERVTLRRADLLLLNEMAPTDAPHTTVRGFSWRGVKGRIPGMSAMSALACRCT